MKRSSPTEDRHTRFPLIDVVTRAKVMDAGTDLLTRVTIYGVALLATAGFVVSAVVDEVLRPRSRVRP